MNIKLAIYLISFLLALSIRSYPQADTVIKWTPERKLSYQDFLAQRPTPEMNHDGIDTLASVYCSLHYNIWIKQGKWGVDSYAYVNPKKSWMDVKNANVLKHEQGHFDIAEIFAKRFEKKINDSCIKDENIFFSYLNSELEQTFRNINEENDKYDTYTMNTLGKEYYDKWINEHLYNQYK